MFEFMFILYHQNDDQMYVCVCVCVCVCVRLYVCMSVCTYNPLKCYEYYMYMHTCYDTHTLTHMRIHIYHSHIAIQVHLAK